MALCLLERMATSLDTVSQVSFHISLGSSGKGYQQIGLGRILVHDYKRIIARLLQQFSVKGSHLIIGPASQMRCRNTV